MSLQQRGMVQFFKAFNENPEALVRLLSMYIAGEERSEVGPLLLIHRSIGDCPLRDLVRRQLQDEGRHARLYRKRIVELGGEMKQVPGSLELQEYYFKRDGSLEALLQLPPAEVVKPERLSEVFLVVNAVEEFLLPRLMAHAEACRDVDPRTHFMLMDIIADEMRHVIYTQEQAYRIAGPARVRQMRALHARLRKAQALHGARVFTTMLDVFLPRDVLRMGRLEYQAWRAIGRLQEKIGATVPEVIPRSRPEQLMLRPVPYGIAEQVRIPVNSKTSTSDVREPDAHGATDDPATNGVHTSAVDAALSGAVA